MPTTKLLLPPQMPAHLPRLSSPPASKYRSLFSTHTRRCSRRTPSLANHQTYVISPAVSHFLRRTYRTTSHYMYNSNALPTHSKVKYFQATHPWSYQQTVSERLMELGEGRRRQERERSERGSHRRHGEAKTFILEMGKQFFRVFIRRHISAYRMANHEKCLAFDVLVGTQLSSSNHAAHGGVI